MRVLVVGAGIVGLASAWWLKRNGHEPVVVEQAPSIPAPEASSNDRHRLIRLMHRRGDVRARTIHDAYAAWETVWGDLGARLERRTGMLMTAREPGDWAHESLAQVEEDGTPHEVWDRAALARRCPALALTPDDWGLYVPQGGALLADRILHGLVRWLGQEGVTLLAGHGVRGLDPDRARLHLEGGLALDGDAVILAAGAWTGQLVPELAPRLEPRRSVVAYLRPPADLEGAWEGSPSILDLGGSSDGYIVPPMEGHGLKWGAGAHARPGDPAAPRLADAGEPASLLAHLRPHLRDLDRYTVEDMRICYTNYTADERFIAGPLGRRTVLATGCSGQMFKFGAAMGQRLADAATGALDGPALAAWAGSKVAA